MHCINLKTPTTQCQCLEERKRKKKIVDKKGETSSGQQRSLALKTHQSRTNKHAVIKIVKLLLSKRGQQYKAAESDVHPISPKTTAPQYQPIDRKEKIVEDSSMDSAA